MGFNSWRDFENFSNCLKYQKRYIHSQDVSEFIINIKKSFTDRTFCLNKNSILNRAQLGHDEFEEEGCLVLMGYPKDRMKPLASTGIEGRGNPKGISYLYLSNDRETCLSELRPNRGQNLSVAQFKLNRDLKIINCYSVSNYYDLTACIFNTP
ncbi:MAG: RES domain-containing protein [Nitrosomonas sp.]|nr:RES domain-containing protein [Nitrosomonas sp.]MBP6076438.1 RES domain-containing protein [Nitrosomonas sp.]